MNNVKGLSFNKDIRALEELSHNEVEKFMSQWCSSKAMRDDYEKRALASLDMRQLSRDGRMRNPDEKPILSAAPVSIEAVKEPSKPSTKKEKENIILPRHEAATTPIKLLEVVAKPTEIEAQKIPETEMPQKEPSKVKEIDPAKLKEMKREEEIAKAKLATERKKKLAEKAAAKAAIRAQKEAEKKLREKERKARKKAESTLPPADSEQVDTDTNEAETVIQDETNVTTEAPIPEKSKDLFKERSIRSHGRGRGQGQIPKALMRRKKAHSFWLWAAPAAVCALLLAIFVYYYSLGKSQ